LDIKRIENCYDSHVHWRATGDFSERISLKTLKHPREILSIPPPDGVFCVLGYGWKFEEDLSIECTKELLDQWCKDRPVVLSKNDGHVLWVNSRALELAGLLQSKPSGILREKERDAVFNSIPKPSMAVVTRHLMKAQKIFHGEGITHIRDVHMNEDQFKAARHLEESGLLKLSVEGFVYDESLTELEKVQLVKHLKSQSPKSSLLRIKGVKVFLDGSLGSETAAISQPYLSGSGHGLLLHTLEELAEIIERAWREDLEVAIHCIGDEAVDRACQAALTVQDRAGLQGGIHFEHVQILKEKNIPDLKKLNAICHLQPSHWTNDHSWLPDKISSELIKNSFPWRRLQEAEVSFYFGSDSPISPSGVAPIQQAIDASSMKGHPKLLGEIKSYLSHPDLSWPANTFTEFEQDGRVKLIHFRGENL